jgi:Ca2+-binding EF-hand superfamily protein
MIPVEVERSPDDWSKEYGQDGKLVYVNKHTGERISSRLSPEEEALEILQRTKDAHEQALLASNHDTRMFFKLFTTDKIPFFVNMESGEAMWYLNPDVPSKCIKFVTHTTDSGVPYYENVEKKTTSWTFPVDQMSSTARKNASSMKKLTKEQLEDKLNITQAEAMQRIQRLKRTGALSIATRSAVPGAAPSLAASPAPAGMLPPTHTASPSTSKIQRKQFKYNNIASVAASKTETGAASSSKSASGKSSSQAPKPSAIPPITASSAKAKPKGVSGNATKPLVRIIFERYDKSKDGFLDVNELQDLFYDYGTFLSLEETQETIDQFDSSNTGSMQYIDFVAWWRNNDFFENIELSEGDVRQRSAAADIFKRYDVDRVGSISIEEFRSLHVELSKAGMTKDSVEDSLKALPATFAKVEFIKFVAWLERVSARICCDKTSYYQI